MTSPLGTRNLSEPDTLYQILLERKSESVLHNIVMIDECSINFLSHYMIDESEFINGTIDYIQCIRALDFNRYSSFYAKGGYGRNFKDDEHIFPFDTLENDVCPLVWP